MTPITTFSVFCGWKNSAIVGRCRGVDSSGAHLSIFLCKPHNKGSSSHGVKYISPYYYIPLLAFLPVIVDRLGSAKGLIILTITLLPATILLPRILYQVSDQMLSPMVLSTAGFTILTLVFALLPGAGRPNNKSDHEPPESEFSPKIRTDFSAKNRPPRGDRRAFSADEC